MTAQVIVAWPFVFGFVLLIVQGVLWVFASLTAQAAAARGLDAARVLGGTNDAGQAETRQMLTQLDTGPLAGARITVTRTGGHVIVRISGHSEQILPWLQLPVTARAVGPVEATEP